MKIEKKPLNILVPVVLLKKLKEKSTKEYKNVTTKVIELIAEYIK
jgi:hypothetical protein